MYVPSASAAATRSGPKQGSRLDIEKAVKDGVADQSEPYLKHETGGARLEWVCEHVSVYRLAIRIDYFAEIWTIWTHIFIYTLTDDADNFFWFHFKVISGHAILLLE